MTFPIKTKRFVFHVEIVPTRPIPQLTHIPSTGSDLPLFSYIGTLNYLLDSRRVLSDGVKKVSFCVTPSPLQAILRSLSQWPSGWFKVPAMLQWHVVATEPRVIEEIRKAPDSVFSSQEAIEEVSSFHIPVVRLVEMCLVISSQIHSRGTCLRQSIPRLYYPGTTHQSYSTTGTRGS